MRASFAALVFVVVGLCHSTQPAVLALANLAGQEVIFKGTLDASVTLHFDQPPLLWWSATGDGHATQLGRFTLEIVSGLGSPHAGFYRFTAANGDTLNAFFVADGPAQSAASGVIVERADVVDGDGRFAGATGTFTITRVYDASTGATAGSFEGTLSLGYSPR
jgi:hypothetical protein